MEGVDSAEPDSIGPAHFELAWSVRMFAVVAPIPVARAQKRLILAGAVLPRGSGLSSALLSPYQSLFAGFEQRV